jgi:hypothetical protein
MVNSRAGTAIEAPPAGFGATINTMVREPPGIDLMPVFRFVTLKAKGDPIAHIKAQIGKINKRLDMMSLQPSPFGSALLASVSVPLVNRLTPKCKIVSQHSPLSFKALSTSPSRGFFPSVIDRLKLVIAFTGTELSTVVKHIREWFATLGAGLSFRGVANRPTSPRAILGGLVPVSFDLKRLATKKAGFCNTITGGHYV